MTAIVKRTLKPLLASIDMVATEDFEKLVKTSQNKLSNFILLKIHVEPTTSCAEELSYLNIEFAYLCRQKDRVYSCTITRITQRQLVSLKPIKIILQKTFVVTVKHQQLIV